MGRERPGHLMGMRGVDLSVEGKKDNVWESLSQSEKFRSNRMERGRIRKRGGDLPSVSTGRMLDEKSGGKYDRKKFLS